MYTFWAEEVYTWTLTVLKHTNEIQKTEKKKGQKSMQEAHSNPLFSTFSFSSAKQVAKNDLYFWGHDYN